jgi:hypothetical protein
MTMQMYEEGNRRLRESGVFQAPEHLFHACYGDPEDLRCMADAGGVGPVLERIVPADHG